ncbi:diphthine synthase [Candidatus Woesearchaeota archaeon]|jgi:diphthine methyl ester synthase|nr:diphthine synthase [Candidatus Woesearchaeota archaeon]MBT5272234.1 diphthine synthase [Candidatus Woesearchaeota archaeon]MBT6040530.1 diphthine synthase [Candidatus Woesearchaeota archaeon]MBT6336506.1 diphthine synthase [Candidatus Woesearchaeota archaeon]MBT7927396.1 diphthine synthase [Candidatus Woesearchaeota archaeon]
MLYLIGLGLGNEKDITVNGLKAVKECDVVYLENYTSKLQCDLSKLEELYGKKIILAERGDVEGDESKGMNPILEDAKTKKVALLVIGDPMGATTHTDMLLRCKELGIEFKVIHNTSILNAIGIVGLELYKFGKTTSIPFPEPSFQPETAYDVLKLNKRNGMHTLCLLDLRPSEERFMTVNDGIKILLDIGKKKVKDKKEKKALFKEDTFCIGCARIGNDNFIKAGKAKDLLEIDFGGYPHCLIIPGKLHFVEEEAMGLWK